MTNEKRVMDKFINMFPEYEPLREKLAMNIYCDIMREDTRKIIAVSDLPHDLSSIGYKLPKSWTIKEG